MHVTIAVDFGQGYQTYMTPEDALRLFETLKEVFEPKESLKKTQERIIQDLRDKGYEVYTASGATLKVEDQASPTEAPGTLHDSCVKDDPLYIKCFCNPCATKEYMAKYATPNGICNDSTIPVENW